MPADLLNRRRQQAYALPSGGLALTGLVGLLMREVTLTLDEVDGLMAGLLTSGDPPTTSTRLANWLNYNADWLG